MKDDRLYLVDMIEIARRVQKRLHGVPREEFDRNQDLQLAITHLLQTIGEAARLVTPQTRIQFSTIPWNAITGMRHRIVHDYLHVRFDVVWKTAAEMAELIDALSPVVDPFIASEKAELESDQQQ